MFKRISFIFILILAVLFLFFGTFSCSKKKAKKIETPKVTLDFMWWGVESETKTMQEIIKKFEEVNPDIKVNFLHVHWTSYWDKLNAQIAAGIPPDVSRLIWQKIGTYTQQDVLLDLTPYLNKDLPGKFMQTLWSTVKHNGEIIGIPFVTDTIALIYNKKYIANAEIKVPQELKDAWTWEKFEEISKKVIQKNNCKYAISFDKDGHRIPIFFYQNGGSLTSKDYKKSELFKKPVILAFEWIKKMHDKKYATVDTIIGTLDNDEAFVQGLVAFNYGGMWMMKYYDQFQKDNWDVTFLPKNKASATCFGGNLLVAYKKTKHPAEAWKLISYITDGENMKKFCEENIFIPARTDIKPDYGPYREKARKFIQQYKTVPEHFVKENIMPAFSVFYISLEKEIAKVVTGQSTPEEAVKKLNSEFENLLKEQKNNI